MVRLVGSFDCRSVVACEKASLELSNPVVAFQESEDAFTCRALLKRAFLKPTIIERPEPRGLSTEHPNKGERRGHSIQKEPKRKHELQPLLGLILDLIE